MTAIVGSNVAEIGGFQSRFANELQKSLPVREKSVACSWMLVTCVAPCPEEKEDVNAPEMELTSACSKDAEQIRNNDIDARRATQMRGRENLIS